MGPGSSFPRCLLKVRSSDLVLNDCLAYLQFGRYWHFSTGRGTPRHVGNQVKTRSSVWPAVKASAAVDLSDAVLPW